MYLLKKHIGICLLLTAILLMANQAYGQLSKAEKKTWKKELRKLSPSSLKTISEENQNLSSMVDMLMEENSQLKSRNFKLAQEKVFLNNQIKEVYENRKTREIQQGLVKE